MKSQGMIMKETITKKIIEKAIELCQIADMDNTLYDNVYIEFGERSIEIIDPTKVTTKWKNK